MPDHRLTKTRATLPEGYQYGDAAGGPGSIRLVYDEMRRRMVPVAFPLDERPQRPVRRVDWNVIEGDPV